MRGTHDPSSLRRLILSPLQFIFLLALLHCPKSLPQQELSEARIQLAAAEEEGASQRETQLYGDSKANLLAAHQFIAEENFSDAQEKAQVSVSLAMDAREKNMPFYLASLEKEAKGALERMTKKGAKEIDLEKFQAAESSYDKAQALRKKGDASTERFLGMQGEKKQLLRRKALGQYRSASLAYKQVQAIGAKLEEAFRSRGLDLIDTIKLAKSELEKARRYGAGESELQKPNSQIADAEKAYQAKSYANATKFIDSARKGLATLLSKLEPAYARALLKKAKVSVAKAETRQKKFDTPDSEDSQNTKKTKILDAVKEQLASAREARDTAENLLGEENYSDSIKESEDAIRLSQVILEQFGLLASGRGAIVTSDGNGLVEDIGGGWKRYTVRDRKPADCLWCIAAHPQVYGSGAIWERIYKANKSKVKNPDVIYPGQKLLIPPPKGPITRPPSSKTDTQ